jgi:hypothetical protein
LSRSCHEANCHEANGSSNPLSSWRASVSWWSYGVQLNMKWN